MTEERGKKEGGKAVFARYEILRGTRRPEETCGGALSTREPFRVAQSAKTCDQRPFNHVARIPNKS